MKNRPQIKLLGVCWGHQLIGHILGIPAIKAPSGGERGNIAIPVSPEGWSIMTKALFPFVPMEGVLVRLFCPILDSAEH